MSIELVRTCNENDVPRVTSATATVLPKSTREKKTKKNPEKLGQLPLSWPKKNW